MNEVTRISVDQVRLRDFSRPTEDEDTIEELEEEIEEYGISSSLCVNRIQDDTFRVIDGNKRLRIARDLGKDTVPVLVQDVDPETAQELALVLNKDDGTDPLQEALELKEAGADRKLVEEYYGEDIAYLIYEYASDGEVVDLDDEPPDEEGNESDIENPVEAAITEGDKYAPEPAKLEFASRRDKKIYERGLAVTEGQDSADKIVRIVEQYLRTGGVIKRDDW